MSLCSDTLVPERSSQKWDSPQPNFFEQILGDAGEGGAIQNLFFGGGSRAGLAEDFVQSGGGGGGAIRAWWLLGD